MTLRIYNTLTRRKEPFEPLEPGHVRMYVCGVTVYDECHVGHARSIICFDVLFRTLLRLGYRVTYVRNFTDLDDKILDRARQTGTPWDQISRTYIQSFHRDMDALGTWRPTVEPLATEHIQEMIQAIEGLESRDLAYAVEGNVYYRVHGFPDYGKLSRRDREEMLAGARIEVDALKNDPLDFALWKRSQPEEPAWQSPWGPGRPGWHIECSAMSQKYLGETFDIHGGGLDLLFPHHENEIAQAEGLTGKPLARFWIHNGPLTREGIKMSKSLGNILSIQEALEQYHPEELRLFMVMGHYRKPLDFSAQAMTEAQAALDRIYSTLQRIEAVLAEHPPIQGSSDPECPAEGPGRGVWERACTFRSRFLDAMEDDFNTAQALAHLFDLNRALNQWLEHHSFSPNPNNAAILEKARACYRLWGEMMGFLAEEPSAFFRGKEDITLRGLGFSREKLDRMLEKRARARDRKDWSEADRIRDELHRLGIQIQDAPSGSIWKVRPGTFAS